MLQRILVWDLPTRIFHWTLIICFAGAYLTGEFEARFFHVLFGYSVLGLILFRVFWGFIGTRHALFSSFVPSPHRLFVYLRVLFTHHRLRYVGHNPAGAMAVFTLLTLGLLSAISGIYSFDDPWGGRIKLSHEWLSDIMLAVAGVHILGITFMSFHNRENLVWSMVTGKKQGTPEQGIPSSRCWVGLLLLALLAGFWLFSLPGHFFAYHPEHMTTSGDLETATTQPGE